MVFSSIPVYLDPPNWNQQSLQLQAAAAAAGGGGPGDAAPLVPGMGAVQRQAEAGSAARPMSMSERARLAKIPQPEQPLKCPRCNSANTKFCYFNNYSLSQPRHFCKACRRYWTRGGALRNVPVGGGCRRNKRSKSSGGNSSKSATAAAADRQAGTSSSSSTAAGGGGGMPPSSIPQHGHLPFLASMHALADYSHSNLGLNFTGIPAIDAAAEYQVGSSSSIQGLQEQWRLPQQIHQFPFMGGLETPPTGQATAAAAKALSGIYNLNGEGNGVSRGFPKLSGTSLITQLASVKMEDSAAAHGAGLSFPRQYLNLPGNEQYWSSGEGGGSSGSGGGWAATDLSVFNSSSSGNIL